MSTLRRVSHAEFAWVVVATFAKLGIWRLRDTDKPTFHEAFAEAFKSARKKLQDNGWKCMFLINLHWAYGTSDTLNDILYVIYSRGFCHYQCPYNGVMYLEDVEPFVDILLENVPEHIQLIINEMIQEVLDRMYNPHKYSQPVSA